MLWQSYKYPFYGVKIENEVSGDLEVYILGKMIIGKRIYISERFILLPIDIDDNDFVKDN